MLTTITTAPKMTASTAGKFEVSGRFGRFPPSRKITPRTEFGKAATLAGAGGCSLNGGLDRAASRRRSKSRRGSASIIPRLPIRCRIRVIKGHRIPFVSEQFIWQGASSGLKSKSCNAG